MKNGAKIDDDSKDEAKGTKYETILSEEIIKRVGISDWHNTSVLASKMVEENIHFSYNHSHEYIVAPDGKWWLDGWCMAAFEFSWYEKWRLWRRTWPLEAFLRYMKYLVPDANNLILDII